MNQQTAQGLAALGRGPDSMLVHMAPSEVAGLQALALKHGGTLTINPETGLAEAGFLKNILPMIAGFALGPAGFGLMSSAMAGLTVGGIAALSSGSLEKGLMAGLGAYGGAGLGESLMGAGTGAMSSAAGAGAPQVAAESLVPQAVMPAATSGVAAVPAGYETFAATPTTYGAFGEAATAPATLATQGVQTVTPVLSQAELAANAQAMSAQQAALINDQAAAQAVGSKLASTGATDTLGAGLKAVTASPSAALDFAKANAYPLGALGIAALAGMDDNKGTPGLTNPGMIRPYTYSRTKVPGAFDRTESGPMSSRERRYFDDQYTALTPYKAPGPEYMAEGGPVEEMSDANAIGMNTGYPQADIRTGAYATPFQQPISRNVVTGVQDAAVNPYTGQAQFADGGSVGGYTFDPRTGLYIKPSGEGATTISPLGGISRASGSSDGGSAGNSDVGGNKNTQVESREAQAARSQTLNDIATQFSKTGITGLALSAINTLFGKQDAAPVTDAGTSVFSGIDAVTGLQGQGRTGQTGLHGDVGVFDSSGNLLGGTVGGEQTGPSGSTSGAPGGTGDSNTGQGGQGTGSECVDPSTLILMADGTEAAASSLRVGDVVHTMHEQSKEFGDFEVVHASVVQQPKAQLVFDNVHVIKTSLSHKFFTTDSVWKRVDALVIGDKIQTIAGASAEGFKTLTAKEEIGVGDVVKFTIKDAHTYISEGLISHNKDMAYGGLATLAQGGMSNLGSYSDGGRLLRGPGDGVSDDIPAMIGQKQQARLADGEFVVPARIVSELGNGSTEAGARQLYAMMDRVQKARKKTVGKDKVATDSRAHKLLPA